MKNAFDPKRPYSGQFHTSFGERGKTIVLGLTMRDIVDCYCKGLLLATRPETDLEDGKTLSPDQKDWEYNDIYKIKMAIDPGAAHQCMMVEVEKMMGIYPNVPELKQAAQQPPAQTVCSNCICEYCKFAKDTETDCGKECGNHFEAFEGRKLLKP